MSETKNVPPKGRREDETKDRERDPEPGKPEEEKRYRFDDFALI